MLNKRNSINLFYNVQLINFSLGNGIHKEKKPPSFYIYLSLILQFMLGIDKHFFWRSESYGTR